MSTNINDLYIKAARRAYRWNSNKGPLTVEDLWTLDLKPLDAIAVALDEEIAKAGRKSFLANTRGPSTLASEERLEIVKDIINVKQAEAVAAADKAARKAQIETLRAALEKKQIDAIGNLSMDELQAKLADLEKGI